MARAIAEIKKEMTDSFIADRTIRAKYGLKDGLTFADQFSVVSVESIWFFIVATAIWTLESLFDIFRKEVDMTLSNKKPHRLKWYRDMTLLFQKDHLLPEDSDVYDTIDEGARVVKHAAAVEPPDSSMLLIKIAGENGGVRGKLDAETVTQVYAYLHHVKDAGVRIKLINQDADLFKSKINILYDAMLLPATVEAAVREAIKKYVENLNFNGEFSNMALVDALQAVEGVRIVGEMSCESKPASSDIDFSVINDKRTPDAGYFAYDDNNITINMVAYELLSD